MSKKAFFFVVAAYFSAHALFDFLRMMFSWRVDVGSTEVPTWVSGVLFIFSVFMVYWSLKTKKEKIEVDVKSGDDIYGEKEE